MISLIISDDKNLTDTLSSYFFENKCSSIVYKWLIKAMDNLEEIKPDYIIISADEYPRHWKTLVQFMQSGIAGKEYKVFLYKKTPFSQEDESKIKTLKINGIFSDYSYDSLCSIFKDFNNSANLRVNSANGDSPDCKINESISHSTSFTTTNGDSPRCTINNTTANGDSPVIQKTNPKKENSLIITNPGTHNFIYGTYVFSQEGSILFTTKDITQTFNLNDEISKMTYCFEDKYISSSGKIINIEKSSDSIKLTITINNK